MFPWLHPILFPLHEGIKAVLKITQSPLGGSSWISLKKKKKVNSLLNDIVRNIQPASEDEKVDIRILSGPGKLEECSMMFQNFPVTRERL